MVALLALDAFLFRLLSCFVLLFIGLARIHINFVFDYYYYYYLIHSFILYICIYRRVCVCGRSFRSHSFHFVRLCLFLPHAIPIVCMFFLLFLL